MAGKNYPLKIEISALDKLAQPMRKINRRFERLQAPVKKLRTSLKALGQEAGLHKLGSAFRGVGTGIGRVGNELKGVATKIAAVTGLATGAGVAMYKAFADSGDEIAKHSKRVGWSVQGLQEAQYIAQRQGATQEQLNSSLLAFSKRMGEAKAGTGGLYSFLERTNKSLMNQMMAAGSNEEAFNLLMAAMRKIEDPAKRAALASAAFSRQGVALTGIADASASAVDEMRQKAHQLGLVISDTDATAAEDAADAMLNLDYAMQGLRNRIGAALAPMFTKLASQFADFSAKHGPALRKWAETFASKLPARLKEVQAGFQKVKTRVQPLITFGAALADRFGGVNVVMTALGILIGGKLIIALGSLVGALATLGATAVAVGTKISAALLVPMIAKLKMLGIAMMTTPLGWFMAGLTGLVVAGIAVYKNWDVIKEKAAAVWGSVKEGVGLVWDKFKAFGKFMLMNNPFALMARGASHLLKSLTGFDVLDTIKQKLSNLLPGWVTKRLGWGDDSSESQTPARTPPPEQASYHRASYARQRAAQLQRVDVNSSAGVRVDFANMPRGAEVKTQSDSGTDLETSLDYSFAW
ncbi:hypothetical protein [Sansalvadorimonas verongulae]|uniref:hypothetical protein n=1 Tax=Sansalvadorimonas verongulae TaxID=2172824 RepID=UPI0012BC792E|nr:hypothetical protein [Sansalvadorimonas verongulae]MTI13366.1 hypothetical protein [Sansalvadorimonas verongulae]